jgi:hypothetical protein
LYGFEKSPTDLIAVCMKESNENSYGASGIKASGASSDLRIMWGKPPKLNRRMRAW